MGGFLELSFPTFSRCMIITFLSSRVQKDSSTLIYRQQVIQLLYTVPTIAHLQLQQIRQCFPSKYEYQYVAESHSQVLWPSNH